MSSSKNDSAPPKYERFHDEHEDDSGAHNDGYTDWESADVGESTTDNYGDYESHGSGYVSQGIESGGDHPESESIKDGRYEQQSDYPPASEAPREMRQTTGNAVPDGRSHHDRQAQGKSTGHVRNQEQEQRGWSEYDREHPEQRGWSEYDPEYPEQRGWSEYDREYPEQSRWPDYDREYPEQRGWSEYDRKYPEQREPPGYSRDYPEQRDRPGYGREYPERTERPGFGREYPPQGAKSGYWEGGRAQGGWPAYPQEPTTPAAVSGYSRQQLVQQPASGYNQELSVMGNSVTNSGTTVVVQPEMTFPSNQTQRGPTAQVIIAIILSVLSIFFCLPMGLCSFVLAVDAETWRTSRKNFKMAKERACAAIMLAVASVVIGVVLSVLYYYYLSSSSHSS